MGSNKQRKALMIAAPASGSGKTILTLGLLRALSRQGFDICGAKAGPDYIDPQFHESACGIPSVNLDPWAMNDDRLATLLHRQTASHVLIEGMMGLYDGARDGSASPADLAKRLDVPIVLVVDCARQSHSVAALIQGFVKFRRGLRFAGVIFNRVGSASHELLLRDAVSSLDIPVLGVVGRNDALKLPERHLGLVQASELESAEEFIANAADIMDASLDLDAIQRAFRPATRPSRQIIHAPPARHIAIARDHAFSFLYHHQLEDWQLGGAKISWFSPLADEPPHADAEFVFLPGGYPELHLETLQNANRFQQGLKRAAENGSDIHGECGGYMVLGKAIIGRDGRQYKMAALLDLVTSFEQRKLHLGYRSLSTLKGGYPVGLAHEFHYTSAVEEEGTPLYRVHDGRGEMLGNFGLAKGRVRGSYMHMIEPELEKTR